ncbi:MAG: TSUP family transporter [Pedobacter sp.]|nr:TSUP family transporter [Chitinophagaceae bacterium]
MLTSTIIILCIVAFIAGFVDAIVGGGGLIQTPTSILLLPQFPVATVIGSLKIPSFSGTAFAAYHYLKKQQVDWKLLGLMMSVAMIASFSGSQLLILVSNGFMKPLLLIVLVLVAIYTYRKKNFGHHATKNHSEKTKKLYAIGISVIIGFYDGFIGPGAGSFLVLAFVSLMGYDFLHASAKAKMVNLATNAGSIILFLLKGKIIWVISIPMAISNALGGIIGAKFAITKGNKFIRVFFLVIVIATLLRFAWDVFKLHIY